ncbi:MAG: dihydrolipoamide acetyltransferase [Candidatus Thermofonsia Clade 1 bacterium]|uniref:Dihydrolipoamide acetyltransferase component of pyruvate dehydrogenase complex n=1 Tax=Candidatus Thermofonsia Clade 1 bacterium TaxID=2364210 RepID=A0A2M8PEN7_9CHLR|nr:MAG: dihydrolipoamide acetyltransferase [Candidatus Thermofonsia Clade 1 bacterium]RMF51416.1 MAG: 2-oxo acid dehydrogenase subunit E2 [Chloroflexota bacterium]
MAEVVKMPMLGANMQEGTFVNWTKEVGQSVQAGEVIAEVEADKATIEIESPFSGVLVEKLVSAGDVVTAGMPLAHIETADGGAAAAPKPAAAAQGASAEPAKPVAVAAAPVALATPAEADPNLPDGVRASPLARRIARERGIDLHAVTGTGPGGRIVKADVERFTPTAVQQVAEPPSAPAKAPTAAPTRALPSGEGIVHEPVSRMRQRIAARTVESKTTIPHFYLTSEVDMAAALALRKQINEGLPEDEKVTVNDLIVKAVALALRKFPNLNSHFYGDTLVRYQYINIGIAVALPEGGLVNVVARNADQVSISQLAKRNKIMFANVREGKIRPEDIEGATFTVSNLGAYEVEHFQAIISPPEAAILAVGAVKQVPVVVNDEIRIGTRMKLSLSVDHRVSDGAEGALFLKALRELLENPMRLLL